MVCRKPHYTSRSVPADPPESRNKSRKRMVQISFISHCTAWRCNFMCSG